MKNTPPCIIVQAGGRGSRLRHHTWNKPKCLVSVRGKPLLYQLFSRFAGGDFKVIGDYAFDQLTRFIEVNPPEAQVELIKAQTHGTASGIREALARVPDDASIILVWSDLIIGELPDWPEGDLPVVCTTSAFTCRWVVGEDGRLVESPAARNGIPGLFYFPDKQALAGVPEGGEFVKWFAANILAFRTLDCPNLSELGDFATLERENDAAGFSRFFNRVEIAEDHVTKSAIDPDYAHLIEREQVWYAEARRLGFRRIPAIRSHTPFVMDRIPGEHLYKIHDLSLREQRAVMADYLDALTALHDKEEAPAKAEDVIDVYLTKTLNRVNSVAPIIPGFERDSVTINGKKCRNVFSEKHQSILQQMMPRLMPSAFRPIHGDPTFSNTLVDDKLRTWFIDPRGYFSKPGIMGDPWYDFAKVYYSAVGGYDAFNRRKFKLHVDLETVEVLYEEPRYAATAIDIFSHDFGSEMARIEVLHGLIWLALSGYVRDDIDSVIGAFYLGLYWLEVGSAKL
ncbi:MAG: hypothetical protein RIR70_495 [Pseudomonadota bacterium]|jgi:aminoglycoside phosphotransferase